MKDEYYSPEFINFSEKDGEIEFGMDGSINWEAHSYGYYGQTNREWGLLTLDQAIELSVFLQGTIIPTLMEKESG